LKTALVLGVNGQDGSYLAEVLIARGYAVTGAGRQAGSRWVDPSRFRYAALDVRDAAALDALLIEVRPDEIYHMAAVHGSAGYAYEAGWRDALAVNVGSVHTCLEHMRTRSAPTRLFYASSVKAFGAHPPECIDETTPRVSDCLYSITKNAATELIHYYRAQHGTWACVGYYFNHDSPRRPDSYFLPRLAASLAAKLGKGGSAPGVATLDFWCDWGSSREFMELTADLLQADRPTDVIFATGAPTYAAQLATELAAAAGLAAPPVAEPSGKPPFRADIGRLRDVVGKIPRERAFEVASWILRERYGICLSVSADQCLPLP
jgi:GDPmannose 4,6-dehydratase